MDSDQIEHDVTRKSVPTLGHHAPDIDPATGTSAHVAALHRALLCLLTLTILLTMPALVWSRGSGRPWFEENGHALPAFVIPRAVATQSQGAMLPGPGTPGQIEERQR